jgi:sterol desaturase/sphingolipid hydroxylase (fatty acid hydroxylase superfamily)
MKYYNIFIDSFEGYWNYLVYEISHPGWKNYFYWLIAVSVFFWALELLKPWRRKQGRFRKDFWLDAFYMFFNFFLFSLIGYNAVSNVVVELFNDSLATFGITNVVALKVQSFPVWAQLLLMFVLRDFIHFNVHRLLHKVPALWEFHKVHHSVEQMGFAAHLRYHWMENVVYRTLEYLPLAMIGFGIQDFFIVHIFALAIGHFNHSNFRLNLGPLKYIFNNPEMHIWHHAKELPKEHKHGVNFGISLSLWDYLFKTNYIPESGRDIPLGFEKVEEFPQGFAEQQLYPFYQKKKKEKTEAPKVLSN